MNWKYNHTKKKQQKIERKNEITYKICTALRTDNDWIQLKDYNDFKRNFELKE